MVKETHLIGRLDVAAVVPDLDLAMAMRPRIEALCWRLMPQVLERVCHAVMPKDLHLQIDRLDLDLGVLRPDHLEEDALAALEAAFSETLSGAIHSARLGPSDQGRLVAPPAARLTRFESYLVSGTIPLFSRGQPFDPLTQMLELAQDQPGALVAMLRRHAHDGHVLERLVRQLGETGLHRLLLLLAPADAAVIQGLVTDIITVHRDERPPELDRMSEPVLYHLIWVTSLEFLLRDAGSQFNRRRFLQVLLEREAGRAGISFVALLRLLTVAAERAAQRSPLKSSLPRILAELLNEFPPMEKAWSASSGGGDIRHLVEGFLRNGQPPHAGAALVQLLAQQPDWLAERLRQMVRQAPDQLPALTRRLLDWLLPQELAELLQPGQAASMPFGAGSEAAIVMPMIMALLRGERPVPSPGALGQRLDCMALMEYWLAHGTLAPWAPPGLTEAKLLAGLDEFSVAELSELVLTDRSLDRLWRILAALGRDQAGRLIARLLPWASSLAPISMGAAMPAGGASIEPGRLLAWLAGAGDPAASKMVGQFMALADRNDPSLRAYLAANRSNPSARARWLAILPPQALGRLVALLVPARWRGLVEQVMRMEEAWQSRASFGTPHPKPHLLWSSLLELIAAPGRLDEHAALFAQHLQDWLPPPVGRDPGPVAVVAALDPRRLLAWLDGEDCGSIDASEMARHFAALADGNDPALRDYLAANRTRPAARARWAAILPPRALGRLVELLVPAGARGLVDAVMLVGTAWRYTAPFGARRPEPHLLWSCLLDQISTPRPVDLARVVDGLMNSLTGGDGAQKTKLTARTRHLARDGGHVSIVAALRRTRPPVAVQPPPPPRPVPPRIPRSDGSSPVAEPDHPIFIGNAGLVLFNPYLPLFFERLGMLPPKEAQAPKGSGIEAASRAVHLLQYLADGRLDAPEPELVLNKLLCGQPCAYPVERALSPDLADLDLCDGLLRAVIANWPALGNSSPAALREAFLQREGRLRHADGKWLLQVQRKTLDVLTDQLPWSFAILYHPWMKEPIHVTW